MEARAAELRPDQRALQAEQRLNGAMCAESAHVPNLHTCEHAELRENQAVFYWEDPFNFVGKR